MAIYDLIRQPSTPRDVQKELLGVEESDLSEAWALAVKKLSEGATREEVAARLEKAGYSNPSAWWFVTCATTAVRRATPHPSSAKRQASLWIALGSCALLIVVALWSHIPLLTGALTLALPLIAYFHWRYYKTGIKRW